jgi:LuxR family transcriptional regulator, maltose regulon positive regulatory protein
MAVPTGGGHAGPLSDRELEILQLIARGLSVSEAANRLVVSVHTVRSHLKTIYVKLEAHSRVQAIRRAQELDLL